jgi:hypothetical protein
MTETGRHIDVIRPAENIYIIFELLKDVEFFEEGNSSYAFMIDKSGRALVHPLLPDATYARLHDDPVQVDITYFKIFDRLYPNCI